MHRNTSINQNFLHLARNLKPQFRFNGKTKSDFDQWRAALHPAAIRSLGTMPKKVPLHPQLIAEWTDDGLIKQRVLFNVEENLALTAYIFRPDSAAGRGDQKAEKLPAILCCHGHGPFGKESVMGNRSSAEHRFDIERVNYNYGEQMAKAGFVTIAIDFRGFGERDDRNHPHYHDLIDEEHGDPCTLHNEQAILLGMTLLGLDVHDAQCALDYLSQQKFVDPNRLGVMGLSFGGTMTTWIALADPRIKAANIICYSDRFADFAIRDANACGSQVTPGLFALCDVPDLQGLIAPRPLLIEIGARDECFHVDSALSCYHELEKIYHAANASEHLELDLFEGGHRWGGHKTVAFFKRWLSS